MMLLVLCQWISVQGIFLRLSFLKRALLNLYIYIYIYILIVNNQSIIQDVKSLGTYSVSIKKTCCKDAAQRQALIGCQVSQSDTQ